MSRFVVLSERDNVATALTELAAGDRLASGGRFTLIMETIPRGHKLALRGISSGQPVIKYGESIGIASRDIGAGTHVHTHNLASARGRGDRDRS